MLRNDKEFSFDLDYDQMNLNIMLQSKLIKLTVFVFVAVFGTVSNGADNAMHDPTQPPTFKKVADDSFGKLEVTSVLISKQRKMVFIGNDFLSIGDKLMGDKIISISKKALILDNHGKKVVLPIMITDVKSKPK